MEDDKNSNYIPLSSSPRNPETIEQRFERLKGNYREALDNEAEDLDYHRRKYEEIAKRLGKAIK